MLPSPKLNRVGPIKECMWYQYSVIYSKPTHLMFRILIPYKLHKHQRDQTHHYKYCPKYLNGKFQHDLLELSLRPSNECYRLHSCHSLAIKMVYYKLISNCNQKSYDRQLKCVPAKFKQGQIISDYLNECVM